MAALVRPIIAAVSTRKAADRRCASRYEIAVPVVWDGGEGLTENLSTAGVYFVTGKHLDPGQSMRLTIMLPRQQSRVVGDGVVVRVELIQSGYGVAVRLESLMPAVGGDPEC